VYNVLGSVSLSRNSFIFFRGVLIILEMIDVMQIQQNYPKAGAFGSTLFIGW